MGAYSFPPEKRIKHKNELSAVIKNRRSFKGKVIKIFYMKTGQGLSRLGISIGKKYGIAVKRNRFKRIIREVFRGFINTFESLDIVVIPFSPGTPLSLNNAFKDFRAFSDFLTE